MFGEDGNSSSRSSNNEENEDNINMIDKVATHNRFLELKKDYLNAKTKANNEYDFFNLIERCILGMDEDDTKQTISDSEF